VGGGEIRPDHRSGGVRRARVHDEGSDLVARERADRDSRPEAAGGGRQLRRYGTLVRITCGSNSSSRLM
jgi:hypothetical protein